MRDYSLTFSLFISLFLSSLTYSKEWNGGEMWDLLDCAERRAMWVWDPAAVSGTKAENRAWDATQKTPRNALSRFFQNYKGSQDLLLDFCENKSIRVLYFYNAVWEWNKKELDKAKPIIPNKKGFTAFVKNAHRRGIQVWLMCYLWDDPNDKRMIDPAQKQSIKRLVEAVHYFNLANPSSPLAGIHLDQEPGKLSVYDDLLDSMKIAQDWVNKYSPKIMISQALRPRWGNEKLEWNGKIKTMNEHIINTVGHAAHMSYNDNVATVKRWLDPLIKDATKKRKKVASGFEVNDLKGKWKKSDKETWWEEIGNESAKTRFKKNTSSTVSFEDAMAEVVSRYCSKSGYDRQVIHSYSGYFKHWFGEHPRDYILNQPEKKYDSRKIKPAKVNLRKDKQALLGLGPK